MSGLCKILPDMIGGVLSGEESEIIVKCDLVRECCVNKCASFKFYFSQLI